MRPSQPESNRLRVAAILVVRDGEEWLPGALGTFARQTYHPLDLVVVDNGSRDTSPEILARHVRAEHLITQQREVGFPAAVASALAHPALADVDAVLLLHDDLALADDAVERLVAALQADPDLAVVGPKLRAWGAEGRLQSVGLSIDRYGRVETGIEAGEYDQGQHDGRWETLYVPTAGMLVRRDVLERVGFDERLRAYRHDLDLCWRTWVTGGRVAVVPAAVGYHAQADDRAHAGWRRRDNRSRYLAERDGIATVWKNSGFWRLLRVVPVMALFAAGRIGYLLAARRVGAASATARAWAWNVGQLPATVRARRRVRATRVNRDRDLSYLFAPGLLRARSLVEVAADWFAGGVKSDEVDDDRERPGSGRRGIVPLVGMAVLGLYAAGAFPLLGPGQLTGGQIAPWPQAPAAFLDAFVAPWGGEPGGSGVLASPAQAVLAAGSLLGFGSPWVAQRLLVLGLLPLAWLLALRAGRLFTSRPAPRVVGATLYVLLPATWAPLAVGDYGALVVAAVLPGVALAGVRAADPRTPPGSAWRAAALLALGLAAMVAFAPDLWPLAVGGWATLGMAAALVRGWQPLARVAVAGTAAAGLLAPWLVERASAGWLLPPAGGVAVETGGDLPLWRALAAVPAVTGGPEGVVGWLPAALAGGLLVGGLVLGLRTHPLPTTLLVAVVVASGIAGWGVAVAGLARPWPPALLLPAALALAGLGVLVARDLVVGLRAYDFGVAHLLAVTAVAAIVAGAGAAALRVAEGPWAALGRDGQPLPAFVTADAQRVGPYRILLVAGDDSEVGWEFVGSRGPTMTAFGATTSEALVDATQRAVVAAAGGADPRAGAALGVLNVRYVVVPDPAGSPGLVEALAHQPALEPLPSGDLSRVYRVESWLPRAAVLDAERARALRATGDPGPTRELEESGLDAAGPDAYAGPVDDARLLVLSEAASPRWHAEADGTDLEPVDLGPVQAFALPAGADGVSVRATVPPARPRLAAVSLLALLVVASLAVRPPGLTEAKVRRAAASELPAELRSGHPRTEEVPS